MGSKSSSAPAPDPRLIEANIRSLGVQDDAIREIMANSRTLMPLQREQLQFGLDTARTAYEQSQADRDWMLGRRGMLSRVQDRLVQESRDFDVEDRTGELRGRAMADVERGFGTAREAGARQMMRLGINPNSGRFAHAIASMAPQQALAKAQAGNMARAAARAEGLQLTDRAANTLAGYPAMSMQATGLGAQFGASGLTLANSGLAGMNSGWGAASSAAAGMGSNAAGMYGAMGSYKNGQDQIAVSSDPFSTVLGAAAGVGTSWALGKLGK